MTKTTSFIAQFVAIIKGDDAEVQAQKAWRQAENAIQTQIHSLQGETMTFEDKLEVARENAANALVNNGQLIADKQRYVRDLIEAENKVTLAEETLKNHKETVALLQSKLKELHQDKDAPKKAGL